MVVSFAGWNHFCPTSLILFQDDLLKGTESKNPKTAATSVLCLNEGLRSFGPKIVDVKPILKQLASLFGHSDKTVREETFKLTVELQRWLGTALNPSLETLKPVQVKELQDAFAAQPAGKVAPARLLRSQQAKGETEPQAGAGAPSDGPTGSAVAEEPAIDPLDLVEEVSVLDKLPSDFYEKMASPKWQERKEALEQLLAVLKAPKFADGRYHELVGVLSKHIHDVNLFVVTLSANAIEKLARGLRTAFAPYKSSCVSPLLEKFKEKKPSVVEALGNALDAVFSSVTFAEIVEDVVAASSHKTPQVKAESLRWLVRCLRQTRKPPGKNEIKALGEMLMKTIDDSANEVRELSAEALGTMLRIVGERPMVAFLDRLKDDKIKDTKVREYAEKAEVKIGGGGASKPAAEAPPPRTAPVRTAPAREAPSIGSSSRSTVAPKTAPAKRPATVPAASSSSGSSSAPAKPKAPAAKPPPVVEEPISFKWTDEGAEEACLDIFEITTVAGLGDTNWKVRLESLNAISENVKGKDLAELDTELLTRMFLRKPSWKENNFQVATVLINLFAYLAKSPKFNKGTASLILPGLVDKLGDLKLKKVASDCMTSIAEGLSLQFVFSQGRFAMGSSLLIMVLILRPFSSY